MFTEKSFQVFDVSGLDERMSAIQSNIQPVFKNLGEKAAVELTKSVDQPFYLHIAQHRRRSVHPPNETWAALSPFSRGYKMDAHFQIGINPDYVFLWLSVIDQPANKEQIAKHWLNNPHLFKKLPADFVFSKDHTKTDYFPIDTYEQALERLATVKKSELQIGRIFFKQEIASFSKEKMLETYQSLLPLYHSLQDDVH